MNTFPTEFLDGYIRDWAFNPRRHMPHTPLPLEFYIRLRRHGFIKSRYSGPPLSLPAIHRFITVGLYIRDTDTSHTTHHT